MNSKCPVLFENDCFLIVDKPAGLSTHNETPDETSVVKEFHHKVHLVNRLDKETSGLLVLTPQSSMVEELKNSLEEKNSIKKYLLILRGAWKSQQLKMDWSWPLTDKGEGRRAPQGALHERKTSLTKILVLNSHSYFTFVEAEILTGRQHQIRKHAAIFGQAIVGDQRYGDLKYNTKIRELYQTSRMMLHSQYLQFIWRGKKYEFTSPTPSEFTSLLK